MTDKSINLNKDESMIDKIIDFQTKMDMACIPHHNLVYEITKEEAAVLAMELHEHKDEFDKIKLEKYAERGLAHRLVNKSMLFGMRVVVEGCY